MTRQKGLKNKVPSFRSNIRNKTFLYIDWLIFQKIFKPKITRYSLAVGLSFLAIYTKYVLSPTFGTETPFLLGDFAIVISALVGGFGPGFLSTLLTLFLANYFFLNPNFILPQGIKNWQQVLAYAMQGLIISYFLGWLRRGRELINEQGESYRVTLSSVGDGVIAADIRNRITFMNKLAEEITGWAFDKAEGKRLSDVFKLAGQKNNKIKTAITKIIKTGEYLSSDGILKRKGGGKIPIEETISPIFDRNTNLIGTSLVFRDITIKKETEQKRDDFVYMISHELKTPITVIKTFSQLLEKRLTEKKDKKDVYFVTQINGQVNRMASLIGELLDFGKVSSGKLILQKKEFDLNLLIKRIIVGFQYSTEDVEIIKKGNLEKKVFADPDRIEQVIVNLIANAIKYSPKGEKIIVETITEKTRAVVSVRDFGVGIADANQKYVFDRYYRVEGKAEKQESSFGLGLYISKEIIDRHSGEIWLKSREKEGSTFYFSLPFKKSTN